ncbi:MAG TPA: DNA-binding response regulator [Dehalococcoidia bacterium]|nr:DNA-binding response regulator [Chloroflexota bacterium]HCE75315.1 DNA-binding response regulator [Dehalococcoidia bacterium]
MNSEKILIIEDEENILEAVKYTLTQEGYDVFTSVDGEDGLEKAQEIKPDLVLLDVMLPKMDGFEVCRILRKDLEMPVFMISAKAEEIDRVVGLEIGADDYITKPFSMRELVVRVRNSLRRSALNRQVDDFEILKFGELEIHLTSHMAIVSGEEVSMKPKEFDLLYLLASHKGRAFTRDQILQRLWDDEYIGDVRTVDVHVRWIREKIEVNPSRPEKLVTIRGVGYRFDG